MSTNHRRGTLDNGTTVVRRLNRPGCLGWRREKNNYGEVYKSLNCLKKIHREGLFSLVSYDGTYAHCVLTSCSRQWSKGCLKGDFLRACPRAVVGIHRTAMARGAAMAHDVICSSAVSWVESAVISDICCSGEEDVNHNKGGSDLEVVAATTPLLLHTGTAPAVGPVLCSCPQSKTQAWSFAFY